MFTPVCMNPALHEGAWYDASFTGEDGYCLAGVGDVVALNSGGPAMTIVKNLGKGKVSCQWFDTDNDINEQDFFINTLSMFITDEQQEEDEKVLDLPGES
jgi:uncharacterized protein YodC (DUF2158 family)